MKARLSSRPSLRPSRMSPRETNFAAALMLPQRTVICQNSGRPVWRDTTAESVKICTLLTLIGLQVTIERRCYKTFACPGPLGLFCFSQNQFESSEVQLSPAIYTDQIRVRTFDPKNLLSAAQYSDIAARTSTEGAKENSPGRKPGERGPKRKSPERAPHCLIQSVPILCEIQ